MSLRQVILDTETTGIKVEDGHRIIEIGCIEMIDRKLTGKNFHYYLNPQREIDAGAFAVHGISNEFLKDKLSFSDIANEFVEFLTNAELIIHNAAFDVSFLNYELSLCGHLVKSIGDYCKVVDTLEIARRIHVGQRNSLDALCKRYSVDNSKRDLHGALIDCYLLAQVYLAMTGGQGNFFETMSTNVSYKTVNENDKKAILKKYNLPVIKADDAEISEHQKYLQKLKELGKCLWSELTEEELVETI